MSLIHGGAAMRIFGPSVFKYLSGMKPCDIIVGINEVPDSSVREKLYKIQSMVNVEDFRIFANEVYDDIVDCGFTKPLSRLLITDKVDVVQSVALHHVLLKTLGELSQFRDGLEPLKIGKTLEQYGGLLRDFFVIKESEVTADYVRKVFKKIRFSEEGSNAFAKEQNSYMMFLEYLDECEKVTSRVSVREMCEDKEDKTATTNACNVSLRMVMTSFPGAEVMPPMGYPHDPEINFNQNSPYPTSSTCALQLT